MTKPRISLLFAITGLSALLIEGQLADEPMRLWLVVLAIFMVGGSANAFNQYFERDIDAQMQRTAHKRPLPAGKLLPRQALIFSIVLAVASSILLWFFGGPLAMALGLATILYYSFFYTLWLKPRTPYNIVIGGAAGAMGPLIAWAAATGTIGLIPVIMFLIIFFWTPPHFWALALSCKEDYSRVGLPMLPLVVGDEKTRQQIFYYSLSILPLSLALYYLKAVGWIYAVVALLLGLGFIWGTARIRRLKTARSYQQFFGYSIIYLLLLFVMMIVDVLALA